MANKEETMVMVNGVEFENAVVKRVNNVLVRVDKKIGAIAKGYLSICGDVAYLYDTHANIITGHKNVYDLCADRFGMARGTVSNLMKIYRRYGEDYKLPEDVSARKLTELLAEIKEEERAAIETSVGSEAEHCGTAAEETEDTAAEDTPAKSMKPIDYTITLDEDWTIKQILNAIAIDLDRHGNIGLPSGAVVKISITKP